MDSIPIPNHQSQPDGEHEPPSQRPTTIPMKPAPPTNGQGHPSSSSSRPPRDPSEPRKRPRDRSHDRRSDRHTSDELLDKINAQLGSDIIPVVRIVLLGVQTLSYAEKVFHEFLEHGYPAILTFRNHKRMPEVMEETRQDMPNIHYIVVIGMDNEETGTISFKPLNAGRERTASIRTDDAFRLMDAAQGRGVEFSWDELDDLDREKFSRTRRNEPRRERDRGRPLSPRPEMPHEKRRRLNDDYGMDDRRGSGHPGAPMKYEREFVGGGPPPPPIRAPRPPPPHTNMGGGPPPRRMSEPMYLDLSLQEIDDFLMFVQNEL